MLHLNVVILEIINQEHFTKTNELVLDYQNIYKKVH
jgi:hypothetical protein